MFSNPDDKGWIEQDSISIKCYDGQNEWAGDNNQIKTVIPQNLLNQKYGIVVSENGQHVLAYDECNELYKVNVKNGGSDSDVVTSGLTITSNNYSFVMIIFISIIILYCSKKANEVIQITPLKKKKVILTMCIIMISTIPGCITENEIDYHSLSLSEPLNTKVQEQPYSDDYLGTVLFDNDIYLQTIDYYFWDGYQHIWGSGPVSNDNSFDISGYCNEDSCMSSLKLYWKGQELDFTTV